MALLEPALLAPVAMKGWPITCKTGGGKERMGLWKQALLLQRLLF